ncbi:MAG: protein kinase [Muribaculaceae bacterium]|nr:protein kinase [Muribaculaceae bacterium]
MTACGNSGNSGSHLGASEWGNIKLLCTRGIYELYTATRYGRKYFIKSLGENYRRLPEWQRLLFKEFELGIRLDHPFIARTVAWENVPGMGDALVMDYVDGVELWEWLKSDNGKDREERLKVARQIAEAINYLHTSGISHRDLKPDNILVTHNGNQVKIVDLGLGDSDGFVVYKHSAATRTFGAPEQMPGTGMEGSMSADIYSFGKILSMMLTGRRYRSLIKRCVREDVTARPSASEVLKELSRNRYYGSAVLWVFVFIALVCAGMLFMADRSSHGVVEVTGEPTTLIDTIYLHKTDTVIVEVAPTPSDSAIMAVWNKSIEEADPQIVHFITYDFPDQMDHSDFVEKMKPTWQDDLYYRLRAIGCTEADANAMREKLGAHISHRAQELKDTTSARAASR